VLDATVAVQTNTFGYLFHAREECVDEANRSSTLGTRRAGRAAAHSSMYCRPEAEKRWPKKAMPSVIFEKEKLSSYFVDTLH
jgi:hypothetical protein